MMGSVLWLPIIFSTTILAFILAMRYFRHRERMEMIRHGMMPGKPEAEASFAGGSRSKLQNGLITVAVGAALTLGLLTLGVGPWLLVGLIPLFVGLSVLLVHVLGKK